MLPTAVFDPSLTLRNQVEYYFSASNLAKDAFLRSKMVNGAVHVQVIAQVSQDPRILGHACGGCSVAEPATNKH